MPVTAPLRERIVQEPEYEAELSHKMQSRTPLHPARAGQVRTLLQHFVRAPGCLMPQRACLPVSGPARERRTWVKRLRPRVPRPVPGAGVCCCRGMTIQDSCNVVHGVPRAVHSRYLGSFVPSEVRLGHRAIPVESGRGRWPHGLALRPTVDAIVCNRIKGILQESLL